MKIITEYEDDGKQSLLEKILYPVYAFNKKKLENAVKNKTILITGASYGIGALLSEFLSAFPVTLCLIARTKEKLEHIKQSFQNKNCKIEIYPIDLRNEQQIEDFLKTKSHKIDIFINNAGKSIQRGLMNTIGRFQDIQRCSAVNYTGALQLLLGVLPDLLETKGHIINVSTINTLLPPTAGWSAYQSSKVAFDQWLRCMEPELNVNKVSVSTLYLPLVRTRMSMVNERNHFLPAMSKIKVIFLILKYIISKKRKYKPWWLHIIIFLDNLFYGLWYKIQIISLKKENNQKKI